MAMCSLLRVLVAASLTSVLAASALAAPAGQSTGPSKSEERARERAERERERERARRLEKLDKDDRAALTAVLDYALPTWTSGLDWIGEAPSTDAMRGKIVVLQTFTTRTGNSRGTVERLEKLLGEFSKDDVVFVAIHTPEGRDRAKDLLAKNPLSIPVAIDRDGAFCDAIGAFRRPVNLVVDRIGDVKAAGLTVDGVMDTVRELKDQPFDGATKPNVRRAETSSTPKGFPTFTTPVRSAMDLRGKPSPPLPKVNWWNGEPNITGKLIIVDFWATWCAPCRAAIPHMNSIATQFRSDVVCLGISDESPSNFDRGLRDTNLKKSDFEYPVGIDPSGSMKKGFGITGIPHVAVISNDGIVRWQGHPNELTADIVRQLAEANKEIARIATQADASRWKRSLENEADGGSQRRR
jgi:thiol-disulfide isomerase/thioredoxin